MGVFRLRLGADVPHLAIFPTLVGVFRLLRDKEIPSNNLPHAGGGVPPDGTRTLADGGNLPHAGGGVPPPGKTRRHDTAIFPTLVGVFRHLAILNEQL